MGARGGIYSREGCFLKEEILMQCYHMLSKAILCLYGEMTITIPHNQIP